MTKGVIAILFLLQLPKDYTPRLYKALPSRGEAWILAKPKDGVCKECEIGAG